MALRVSYPCAGWGTVTLLRARIGGGRAVVEFLCVPASPEIGLTRFEFISSSWVIRSTQQL